jgi:hypothetical protein
MSYKIVRRLGIVSLVVSGWLMSSAQAEDISMAEVPSSVRSTIEKEAKGHEVTEIEREKEDDGKVIFEAEWREEGRKIEIKVDEQGKLIERKVKKT